MMKKTLIVDGMSCGHCVTAVTEALEEIGGKEVKIDLETREVLVDIDGSDAEIKDAIEGIGFDLEAIK